MFDQFIQSVDLSKLAAARYPAEETLMAHWMKREGYKTCTFPFILRMDPWNLTESVCAQVLARTPWQASVSGIYGLKINRGPSHIASYNISGLMSSICGTAQRRMGEGWFP